MEILFKFLKSRIGPWMLVILIGFICYYQFTHPKVKEILIQPDVTELIDSITTQVEANTVSISTYNKMQDSLTLRIKNLQSDLKIKNKDLKSAAGIISALKDTIENAKFTYTPYVPSDSSEVVPPLIDSFAINYTDKWTYIHAEGRVLEPDSVKVEYSMNADLTLIDATTYKPAKTAFGRWWNRLWKIGKRNTYTIRSENPNLQIEQVEVIKIKSDE